MGIILLDEIATPFLQPKANIYAAFGKTNASIECGFDENHDRQYKVNVSYGMYFDEDAYTQGLEPMSRQHLFLVGNVQQVSNIHHFISTAVIAQYGNVLNDGLDN